MMALRRTLVLAVLLLGAASSTAAQATGSQAPLAALAGPRPAPAFATLVARDSVAKPTHWKRGAVTGGAALGGASLLLGLAYLAGDSDVSAGDVAIATVASAAFGAFIGAMIGGLFRS
jgi:peptidoglycan/LPS O-acetylase OafA/YrhL